MYLQGCTYCGLSASKCVCFKVLQAIWRLWPILEGRSKSINTRTAVLEDVDIIASKTAVT